MTFFISACLLIAPFIDYVKYHNELGDDIEFVSKDTVAAIGRCSHPNYSINSLSLVSTLS